MYPIIEQYFKIRVLLPAKLKLRLNLENEQPNLNGIDLLACCKSYFATFNT